MKIGLDLDDTITELPEFFSIFTKALIKCGHEIYIITYRDDREYTVDELRKYDVAYTDLILSIGDETPPQFKARIARKLKIDVMIDDSPENLAAMPDGVKRMWVCDPNIFDLKKCIKAMKTVSV